MHVRATAHALHYLEWGPSVLDLRNISKSFPGVRALDEVSMTVRPGEIHALLGENGAGKSTLINIISGIYQPDSGEVFYEGRRQVFHDFRDALDKGIALVSQERQVLPDSSIAENIMLDKMASYRRLGVLKWKQINSVAKQYMDLVGLQLAPTTPVANLSAATKQLIQIAKALAANARILLLDEPTSSLTEHEVRNLFGLLRKIREQGVLMVFVSHKLEEVYELCDTITVLRDGRLAGSAESSKLSKHDLVKMMIGRDAANEYLGELAPVTGAPVLEVRGLSRKDKINQATFSLGRGEILGFYGLVGSGRTELAKLIIGEDRPDAGEVYVNGKVAHIHSPAASLYKYNIGYVSENRKDEGLILDASVKTNITITVWRKLLNRVLRFISLRKESEAAQRMVDALSIKVTGLEQVTNTLSGGNQQKVSIAKWLAAGCDVLIIDEPTVGVDIGAKEYIHNLIWKLAKEDRKAIILISSDMPEMIKLARRILVFRDHRIVGEIDNRPNASGSFEQVSHQIGHFLA